MAPTLSDLFSSPDHYLYAFDGDDAVFVPMTREAYRRSIFLDDRIEPASETAFRVPVRDLLQARKDRASEIGFIFHIAHCGSTLLARALDALGADLVLREPLALRQAALANDPSLLALTLRMLAKSYREGSAPLVKANVPVNFVIPQITDAMPHAAAVFLHYGIEDYALAILRSDNHRAWLRRVTGELSARLNAADLPSDGARVAALWLAQMRMFRAGLNTMSNARTLDAELFFADPARVLNAAAMLFGLSPDSGQVDAVIGGDLFATYAKNPAVRFANGDRVARRNALRLTLAADLDAARHWLVDAAPDRDDLLSTLRNRALV